MTPRRSSVGPRRWHDRTSASGVATSSATRRLVSGILDGQDLVAFDPPPRDERTTLGEDLSLSHPEHQASYVEHGSTVSEYVAFVKQPAAQSRWPRRDGVSNEPNRRVRHHEHQTRRPLPLAATQESIDESLDQYPA